MFSADDHRYMARALQLARLGMTSTAPNPRVGCVVVSDGQVAGEGWHVRAGTPHAERHALAMAGERARGATAYVTLEPCSHHGRTPPCTEALLAAGIRRVVAAMADPNPLVAGRGLAQLQAAGVAVDVGLMADEAHELNIGFVSRMTRQRPWVRLKAAASLDGKTALQNGESQWITGPQARQDGHCWRARACAILSGIGTVRKDDPQLNVRGVDTPRQPLKVIVDSRLELSPAARLLEAGNVLLVSAGQAVAEVAERAAALRERGAEILDLPDGKGRVDLHALLHELAQRGLNEVHVEAGSRLNGALLAAGLVDEVLLYLAPCLLGDTARGLFALPALESLAGKHQLAIRAAERLGDDLRVLARTT